METENNEITVIELNLGREGSRPVKGRFAWRGNELYFDFRDTGREDREVLLMLGYDGVEFIEQDGYFFASEKWAREAFPDRIRIFDAIKRQALVAREYV